MVRAPGARDLAFLAVGVAVSSAGDSAAQVALLLRLRPAGSEWVAAALAAEFLPAILLAALVGRLIDRVESHRLLVIGLGGQAVLAVPLAFAGPAWANAALFLALSIFSVAVRPSTAALIPVIAGEDRASTGYARIATGSSLGFIVGPVVGGLLTGAIGTTGVLLLDAASFATLALAASTVRARRPPAEKRADGQRPSGGFALIWHSPVLRIALTTTAVAVGCAVLDNVAAPFRFVDQLAATPTEYGAYLTVWGAGAFVGIQIVPRLARRVPHRVLAAGNVLLGLGIAGIGVAPVIGVALVASLFGGVGNGISDVATSTTVSSNTEPDERGRVFAATGGLIQLGLGVGTVAAAPILTLLTAGQTMMIAGLLAAGIALLGLTLTGRPSLAGGEGHREAAPRGSAP